MRTNVFKVKEKKDKKIVIEEERTKNSILLFFKRHRKLLLLLIITLLLCLLLVSVGIAFSLFRGSNDYDISYIDGGEIIGSNNDPNINDDDVGEELLGEISRSDGVVVLVETFMSSQGDVVYYYTDGTSVVVQASGKIYRVSPKSDGSYGIDRNGKIDSNVKKILVTSTTTTLMDGTVITYYSDGTAKVDLKGETIVVRDSNNIKLSNGEALDNVMPSGVSLSRDIAKLNMGSVITFTDKTSLVILGDKKYIVNKNTGVSVADGAISYDVNNIFEVLGEKTYSDGNTITHFANGAATITDKNGNVIYVKKSGDILLKGQKLYEIITNEYGYSRSVVHCSNGREVTYFDNGAAIIVYPDGTRQYVSDNTEIIYDGNKNISSLPNISGQVSEKTTANGERVINFDNGKSQVIKNDGTSYIVDTSKITFKPDGNIKDDPMKDQPIHGGTGTPDDDIDLGEGIYVSEAENKYNDFKNIEDTTFIIKNNNNGNRILRIAIEEVPNYNKYNTSRLNPRFVKFQATIGDSYIGATSLTNNTWVNSNGTTNYVIYDGTIKAKSTIQVALSLYVDYAMLDNSYQNKGFIGTIKIYVEG